MRRKKYLLGTLLGGLVLTAGWRVDAIAAGGLPREPSLLAGKTDPGVNKSVPSSLEEVKAPKGAPNVIVILLDDVGFSASSVTGGPAAAPNLERLAREGLLYNNFHVNAYCSPTRAALLTGRNSHQVGFGTFTQGADAAHPGYNSLWPKSAASIAEVLKGNGYSTAAFGKWHNTPVWQTSPVGPFDRWPTGLGFEYFYGFLEGADSQWTPALYRNTVAVEPSTTPSQGYHLTTDMANDAITWLHQHDALAADKPFFLYFAPGATHSPHQVSEEWIAKYKGRFDAGWDELRKQTFERQKKSGIIPANAKLTPRPEELPAWDSLTPEERKLLSRQAEVYAGFFEQTDHEIGRLLQAVRDEGQWDNTLVLYIIGDNGASGEGSPLGNDARTLDGEYASVEERSKIKLGSNQYFNNYASGWGWALDAPFQWAKPVSAFLGGTTDPLIVSWPARLRGTTGVRGQFQHVTDIAPTIYEAAGISAPEQINGVKQTPLEGQSLAYTFAAPQAPSRHTQQYFETIGSLGIYKDGWWAGKMNRLPWGSGKDDRKNDHPWELYNLATDYSQAHNLASTNPTKLKELVALFDSEARRNNVYPLVEGRLPGTRKLGGGRTHFVFRQGVERIPGKVIDFSGYRGATINADVTISNDKTEGVIIANGGTQMGYTLYVQDGRAVFETNTSSHPDGKIVSKPLAPGARHITIEAKFEPDAPDDPKKPGGRTKDFFTSGGGGKGTIEMVIDGVPQGQARIANLANGYLETLDVGKDLGSPVSQAYQMPFAFNGTIDKVTIDLN
ncbi:arylsulfatase [Mesorhizobium sp. ArgA1]